MAHHTSTIANRTATNTRCVTLAAIMLAGVLFIIAYHIFIVVHNDGDGVLHVGSGSGNLQTGVLFIIAYHTFIVDYHTCMHAVANTRLRGYRSDSLLYVVVVTCRLVFCLLLLIILLSLHITRAYSH